MKRIVFLTSTNLACNPRCLKEVELAHALGYDVTVFAFDMANWTREMELQIRDRLPEVKYHSLQTGRKPFIPWFTLAVFEKVARILYRLGVRVPLVSAIAVNKRTFSLWQTLRKEKPGYDLVIAHNPGAFYPALWFSRKKGISFAIDIEDFHPGETSDWIGRQSVTDLIKICLPAARYISFASPLIQEHTLALLGSNIPETFVVNNVFSEKEFPKPPEWKGEDTGKIKLVWFSQHISFGRGLEEVLPLLAVFSDYIQLTLIGNIDGAFEKTVVKNYNFIVLKEPLPQELLNAELGNHDIGLAIESNSADDNRKICLTNKIWAYLQAGLYIWATNTPAQCDFAKRFPDHVSIIELANETGIRPVIQNALNALSKIRGGKPKRWEINKLVSWETEKEILVKYWNASEKNEENTHYIATLSSI